MKNLLGKSYTFEDGDSITVSQIKERDGNQLWVTYLVQKGPGIAQKLVLPIEEFNHHYGHLFGISQDKDTENPDK